jgi:membrane protein DedA with SNARE-associated domain
VSLEYYISTYGYLAVFLGVFVEGEAIVVTAGFLAFQGLLDLHWVILSALAGSICTYQGFFYLGRSQGTRFLDRRPHWKPRVSKIQSLLQKHYLLIIFGYRMFFGFRSITPFALGMTNIKQSRFFVIDLLPAITWSVTFSILGYFFGQALQALISDLEKYKFWIASAFFTGIFLIVSLYVLYQKRVRH